MHTIIIQYAVDKAASPKASLLRKWAKAALSRKTTAAEVTIRIVDEIEMTQLNKNFRFKDGPTNVLSFPLDIPDVVEVESQMIGDIVICASVVNREAKEQGKLTEAHWAHMVVHGIFHLLGYDHQTDSEALIMETMETEILSALGFPNPYQTNSELDSNHDR